MSHDLQLAMNTIRSPITQSGRVVFNGQKDPYTIWQRTNDSSCKDKHPADCDECYSVLTHELAYHHTVRHYETNASAGDRLPIITSFNHVSAEKARSEFAFIGVVSSGARHSGVSQAANEEDCTVQIGGLCTVINNSEDKINAGQPVYATTYELDVDKVKVLGTPHAKVVARLSNKPFQNTKDGQVYQPNQYVGRAMSSAVKGAAIDLLLGSQC